MDFAAIFVLLVFVEGLTENVSWMVPKAEPKLVALVISVLLTVLTGTDAFARAGVVILPQFPIYGTVIGSLLTGVLFARGSNWFHELYKRVQTVSVKK